MNKWKTIFITQRINKKKQFSLLIVSEQLRTSFNWLFSQFAIQLQYSPYNAPFLKSYQRNKLYAGKRDTDDIDDIPDTHK